MWSEKWRETDRTIATETGRESVQGLRGTGADVVRTIPDDGSSTCLLSQWLKSEKEEGHCSLRGRGGGTAAEV